MNSETSRILSKSHCIASSALLDDRQTTLIRGVSSPYFCGYAFPGTDRSFVSRALKGKGLIV